MKQVKAMSTDRRALLSLMLQERGVTIPARAAIPRREPGSPLPLSFAEERLWLLDRLAPGGDRYNIPAISRLSGNLDVPALQRSLTEIARRHETLRTTFAEDGEVPYRVIAPAAELPLSVCDLTATLPNEREAAADRVIREEATKPFDLVCGPLFRGTLVRLSEREHILALTFHHIVADGWSLGVFTREFATLYEAFSQGRHSPLTELPIQYADFAIWERDHLRGPLLDERLAYWRQHLHGSLPTLQLPVDRPRPEVPSYRGRHEPIRLGAPLTKSLRDLGRQQGVTLYVVLLTAFHILLHRYSGQLDIIVGSPLANRGRQELENLIGFFVNTLPLRIDLTGNPTFRELLQRVQRVTLGAAQHEDLPLARLVSALRPERHLNRNPLFQVEFALLTPDHNPAVYGYGLQSPVQCSHRLCDLTVKPQDVEGGIARFDISIFLWDLPDMLSGVLEYSAELFDQSTITGMLACFEDLLGRAVAAPDSTLDDLVEHVRKTDRLRSESAGTAYDQSSHRKLLEVKRNAARGRGKQGGHAA